MEDVRDSHLSRTLLASAVISRHNLFDRRVEAVEWLPLELGPDVVVGSHGGDITLVHARPSAGVPSSVPLHYGKGKGGAITSMRLDPFSRGIQLYTTSHDGTVTLHNLSVGAHTPLLSFDDLDRWFTSVDVDPCEPCTVYAVDNAGFLAMLDRRAKRASHLLRLSRKKLSCVRAAPDGRTFTVGGTDGKLCLYDVRQIRDGGTWSERQGILYGTATAAAEGSDAWKPVHGSRLLGLTAAGTTTGSIAPLHTWSHGSVVSSAYFDPLAGSRLLVTLQGEELRVYSPATPDAHPVVVAPHPHRFYQHLTIIKGDWHPHSDRVFFVCRYDALRGIDVFASHVPRRGLEGPSSGSLPRRSALESVSYPRLVRGAVLNGCRSSAALEARARFQTSRRPILHGLPASLLHVSTGPSVSAWDLPSSDPTHSSQQQDGSSEGTGTDSTVDNDDAAVCVQSAPISRAKSRGAGKTRDHAADKPPISAKPRRSSVKASPPGADASDGSDADESLVSAASTPKSFGAHVTSWYVGNLSSPSMEMLCPVSSVSPCGSYIASGAGNSAVIWRIPAALSTGIDWAVPEPADDADGSMRGGKGTTRLRAPQSSAAGKLKEGSGNRDRRSADDDPGSYCDEEQGGPASSKLSSSRAGSRDSGVGKKRGRK